MGRTKLGLIGLGYVGRIHLQNCLKLKSAELSAVSDLSKKALSSAKKLGAKNTFQDYQQLLKDDDVDAVIIALPTHLHLDCVRKATEAGKHILVEKPLARNVAEGKEMVSSARKNGVKLMVGYHLRFCSSFQALKEKMQTGILGEVQIAYATNVGPGPFMHRADGYSPRPVPSWWFRKELTGGGALMDSGSHMVNLLRWYFGEVSNIKCYLGYRLNMNAEDHAVCLVRFATGKTVILNIGWFSQKSQTKVEIYGTVKHDYAEHAPPSKAITILQLLTRRTPSFYLPYLSELGYFAHCVRHDLQPAPSGDDALKDLETISLAYENGVPLRKAS
ncbi:Gfo/Idh/MocA family oxidoreductase [Candidatus Bathyarchaeota archaeon]|nr:Gfo/Idh/MocA family oxidoreductase [Candidatus Bathyarchaeota archaeon]